MKFLKLKRRMCCLLCLTMLTGLTTVNVCAATEGQKSLKNIGVNITWFDLGKQFTDYWIRENVGNGLYQISVSNDTDTKSGIVNGKGEMVLAPDHYEIYSISSNGENISFAVKDGSCKVIDSSGIKSLDTTVYSKVEPFPDSGYATVTWKADSKKGIMDKAGALLFTDKEGKYMQFAFVADGLFSAQLEDGGYDLLNSKGERLNQMSYREIFPAEDGIIPVQSVAGTYGSLNLSGKEIIPAVYDERLYSSQYGLTAVNRNGKWGFADSNGSEVIPCQYDDARSFCSGLAPVCSGSKWGLINEDGTVVLPLEYEGIPQYQYDAYTVQTDGKTLIIDCASRAVKEMDYSYIRMEGPNLVYVEKTMHGSKVAAYLDNQGNNLTGFKEFSPMYLGPQFYLGDKPGEYPEGATPPNDYDRIYALLDSKGNNLTGFKYKSTRYSSFDGFQVMGKYYDRGQGLVNQNGAEVLPPVFEDIMVTHEGYAFVSIKDPDTGRNNRVGYFKIPESFYTATSIRPITVYLDGTELFFQLQPTILNEETMVPMRKIFESLGSTVQWDNSTKTITAVNGDKTISLTVDSNTATVNGNALQLKTAPFLYSDTTFVPLRLVSESLGAEVSWDGALRRVVINTNARLLF